MFQPEEFRDIPFTDLLTWTFGNGSYDHDKPIFINAHDPENTYSYNQARSIVKKLIAGLQANGLEPGDSVCLHSFNNINYPLVYLAVIGAGGRFVGSNPSYTTSELLHLFKVCEVKFVLVEPDLRPSVEAAANEYSIAQTKIWAFDVELSPNTTTIESWERLLEHGENDWVAFDDETLSKGTVAALMSTSGTTGLPKAAQSSHYSQVAQSVVLMEQGKPYQVIRLLCLPQFHAFNAPLGFIAPIREGHTTYMMKRYEPRQHVEFIEKYKITETTMVSPILFRLMELPEERRKALCTLRLVWCGGVPLDATVQNQFSSMLHPDASVSQVYGMTEIFWITSFKYSEKDTTASVGRLLPNTQAKIVDENGDEVSTDEITGHILVQSPSLMMGYLNNPNPDENPIVDGWLITGDIGYQKGGKWYVVDRAKEIIKVRGWQVSPTELEACLILHPAIQDAAVIGVDFKDQRGELPRAYVVLYPGMEGSLTEKEIQNYVRQRLANYKALDGGVCFRSMIPRSPAGKILKKIFRQEAKEEIQAEKKHLAMIASSIVEGKFEKKWVSVHERELVNDGVLEVALEAIERNKTPRPSVSMVALD